MKISKSCYKTVCSLYHMLGDCYITKIIGKGEVKMWVISVFEKKNVRIFEYTNKNEATAALAKFKKNAVLTYTK